MGKVIQFPCVDHYEEWNYEEYYANEGFEEQDYGEEMEEKENWVRRFIRKCLMFVLVRL